MVGQTVGKYRVQDRIGRGGMGTVYRATDETLHREVAIKVLNPELNDPEVARRFRSEAITVARLSHPGIATIYELFEYDGQWLMVMEFVRGETLEHLVERTGGIPIERATDFCIQALTALAHAHSLGVVHRDLKPANLMVTEQGTVKIMDFGIARVAGTEHLTTAGFMMGTPAYMAPEQVLGKEVDGRADLYAIGVVLYRITTGKLPFKGDTPFAMAQSQVHDHPTPVALSQAGLPGWVEQVIGRALSKAPEDRFQTADEFRESLKRGLAGLPIEMAPNAFIPPELMMTTPPRTLPTVSEPTRPIATGSAPVSATQPQPAAAQKPAAAAPVRGKSNLTMIGVAAALVVVGAIAVGVWYRSRTVQAPDFSAQAKPADSVGQPPAVSTPPPETPPPQPSESATPPPASQQTAPASVKPPAGTSTSATGVVTPQAPAAGASPSATGNPTSANPSAAQPAGSGTRSGAAPATPGAAAGPPSTSTSTAPGSTVTPPAGSAKPIAAENDAHVAFSNVKFLTLNGRKAQDQDVVLNFVGGQISVVSRKGGSAITSLPYRGLSKATYVRAKHPKWDAAYPSPPDDLDLPGGFLRSPSRHWLVLQSHTSFLILRLEDENVRQVLDAIESRTGMKVDRPAAAEK